MHGIGVALSELAVGASASSRLREALSAFRAALDVWRDVPDRTPPLATQINIGKRARATGRDRSRHRLVRYGHHDSARGNRPSLTPHRPARMGNGPE